MRSRAQVVLVLAMLVAPLACSSAWGAVSMSWEDALGYHAVALQNVQHPNWDPSDPLNWEDQYCWRTPEGGITIYMDTPDPITFYVTGNFEGAGGEIWTQIVPEQYIVNLTGLTWTDFHLEIIDEGSEFYNWFLAEQGWDTGTSVNEEWRVVYGDMAATAPEYHILPGGTLDEGLIIWADVDYGTGDGSATYTKMPTYPPVPEPSSLAALLGALAGLMALGKRRKV